MTQTQQESRILIPRKIVETYLEGIESTVDRADRALKNLTDQGYTPVYMPQLVDARMQASKDDRIWQTHFTTPSIIATGKTSKGALVVVYSHKENYFSYPKNIESAINWGMVNYAGRLPQDVFQSLVDMDGQTDEYGDQLSFVLDADKLRKSKSGIIPVKQALDHPQTIPFLGGENRAQRYLQRHEEVYGDKIRIWHRDDLSEDGEPLARLLWLGNNYNNGLLGNDDLDDGSAHFLGVRAQNFGTMQNTSLEMRLEVLQEGRALKFDGELYIKVDRDLRGIK